MEKKDVYQLPLTMEKKIHYCLGVVTSNLVLAASYHQSSVVLTCSTKAWKVQRLDFASPVSKIFVHGPHVLTTHDTSTGTNIALCSFADSGLTQKRPVAVDKGVETIVCNDTFFAVVYRQKVEYRRWDNCEEVNVSFQFPKPLVAPRFTCLSPKHHLTLAIKHEIHLLQYSRNTKTLMYICSYIPDKYGHYLSGSSRDGLSVLLTSEEVHFWSPKRDVSASAEPASTSSLPSSATSSPPPVPAADACSEEKLAVSPSKTRRIQLDKKSQDRPRQSPPTRSGWIDAVNPDAPTTTTTVVTPLVTTTVDEEISSPSRSRVSAEHSGAATPSDEGDSIWKGIGRKRYKGNKGSLDNLFPEDGTRKSPRRRDRGDKSGKRETVEKDKGDTSDGGTASVGGAKSEDDTSQPSVVEKKPPSLLLEGQVYKPTSPCTVVAIDPPFEFNPQIFIGDCNDTVLIFDRRTRQIVGGWEMVSLMTSESEDSGEAAWMKKSHRITSICLFDAFLVVTSSSGQIAVWHKSTYPQQPLKNFWSSEFGNYVINTAWEESTKTMYFVEINDDKPKTYTVVKYRIDLAKLKAKHDKRTKRPWIKQLI